MAGNSASVQSLLPLGNSLEYVPVASNRSAFQPSHTGFSQPERWRFSVDDYAALAKFGIISFEKEPRTELIEGEIFAMTAMGSRHFWAVGQINALLFQHLASAIAAKEIFIAVQSPIALTSYSQPEPDIAIFRYSPDFDKTTLPTASDVILLIEVADATLEYDRNKKSLLYAQAEIPEYWIVNLVEGVLEVFQKPQQGMYATLQRYHTHETVPMPILPPLSLAVAEIFP